MMTDRKGKGMNRYHKRRNRKRRVMLIWSGVILLFLFLTVILVLLGRSNGIVKSITAKKVEKETPEQLLKDYYSLAAAGKYEKMYQMLDETSKASISQADFVSRNEKIYQGIEADQFSVQKTETDKQEDGAYLVKYEVKMNSVAGTIDFPNQTIFHASDSGKFPYLISWDDSMIFPLLTPDDKVSVTTDPAARGSIYDRNGKLLAGPGVASSVGLVPGKMNQDPTQDEAKLAQILGVTPESIQKKLTASWVKPDSFVPIKTVPKLTDLEQEADQPGPDVQQKQERNKELLAIPGVLISDTNVRQYPLGKEASHLIGYIQQVTAEDLKKNPDQGYNANSMIGRSGMESLYEKDLKGQNGCKISIVKSTGEVKSILATSVKQDGKDIYLTIDSDLQKSIYDTFNGDKSCSVAMNPNTGEILALVSTPSYDSNDFIMGMSSDEWNSLNSDPNKPMYNRFRQVFTPGSSIKPVMAAIGLKTGAIDPNEDIGTAGKEWQKDKSWGSYFVTTLHTYSPVNLQNALIYSDNIYFAKAALKIGSKNLQSELDALGFNQKLPFEISVSKSQYANKDGIKSEIQLADSGYGQGQVLVNPIHLAALYSGFANGGDVLQPQLLYQQNAQKKIWLQAAYVPDQAEMIRQDMIQVVASPEGTGHGAFREDISLAGKTGTAEIKASKADQDGTELGWFGIYTADQNAAKPILLLSMVEDVKDRGGSAYVVGKSKQILDGWFAGQ